MSLVTLSSAFFFLKFYKEQEQTNEKEVKQVEKTVTPLPTNTESYATKIKNNASKLKSNKGDCH